MSIIHLFFVVTDILMVMILVKVSYDRWHFIWLRSFANLVEPALKSITDSLGNCLSRKTGKVYPEKTRLLLLVLSLLFVRLFICALV
jgi:hypothetical protein